MLGGILLGVRPALARMPYISCVFGVTSDVNKVLGFKAKAKDLGFKAKAKDLSFKAKAKNLSFKAKDLTQVLESRPRT